MKRSINQRGNTDFIKFFFNLFYRIHCNQNENENDYFSIDRNLFPTKEDINVLICGAGSCINELPVLLSLFESDRYNKIYLTFVDVDEKKEPFKLLHFILQKYGETGCRKSIMKHEIEEYFDKNEENPQDYNIIIDNSYSICKNKIEYSFHVMDLELDPDEITKPKHDSRETTTKDRYTEFNDYFKDHEYDIVMMSMFLQHISYWRSLIAFLNEHLKVGGYFWFNEFGKDDYLLTWNLYMAIIDNKRKGRGYWKDFERSIIENFEQNRDKAQMLFSIISDNDEISPTNTEICRDFFAFFGSEGKIIFEEGFQSDIKNPSELLKKANNYFSPFTKLQSFIKGETLSPTFSKDNSEEKLDLSMTWYAYPRVKDDRIKHFNVLDEATKPMEIPVLQDYINRTLDILNSNSTIFRPTFLRTEETSKYLVKSSIDLFRRFQLFKIGDFQSIVFYLPEITTFICYNDTTKNYKDNFNSQKKFKSIIDDYNIAIKGKRESNSTLFFDKYKTMMTKPFTIFLEPLERPNNTNERLKFDIEEFGHSTNQKVHILRMTGTQTKSSAETTFVTPLGVSFNQNSLTTLYNTFNEIFNKNESFSKSDKYRSILIPCFREPLFDKNKEFLGDLIIFQKKEKGNNRVDDTPVEFFSWLIRKFVDFTQIASYLDYKRIILQSIKSAKAAIMSRNISHNLGSHVMFYIKQKLESVNSILGEGTLLELVKAASVDELKNKVDDKSVVDGKEFYFLVGLGRFINYLQERQDYIATIATDYIPYKSTVNFKDVIYDELKPELKSQRHKDDCSIDGKHAANLLLDYIAYSEGFHSSNRIELWYNEFNGTGKPQDVPDELRNFNVDLPGGTLGRQAFFSIMENIIRNTAKHESSGMSGRNMKFIFKQLTKIDRLKAWTNEKRYPQKSTEIEETYHEEKNRSNYYYLGITVDLGAEVNPNTIIKIKKGLNEDYFENGSMNANSKGIKEIRISAAWIRRFWIDDVIPIDEPPAVAIRETKDGRLQYVICLPKSKRVVFVTNRDTQLDKNGCRHFASKWIVQNDDNEIEKKSKEIADFDLIVCPEHLCALLRKYVGSRILSVSNVDDYTRRDIPNLYQDWLKQQFKEVYSSGQLPTIVINDGKSFLFKKENGVWKNDAQLMIDAKKVECSSDAMSDQIVFAKHYNWSENGKRLRKEFYSNAKYIEGISGGNSTDRLIRHDTWDGEWYVKLMTAALTHVAIIDERIYNTFVKESKITLPDWTQNEEEIKKWLQKYNSELKNYKRPKYFLYDKASKDISRKITIECVETLLIQNENEWTTAEDSLILKEFINKIHGIGGTKDYSNAILFAQKGVCAFNIIPDDNKVTIKGYSPKRKEECEVATIIYDSKEKKLSTHCDEEFRKKFHFVSIHQGVLEKMYESFIKDNNGIQKSDVTRAVFDIFSMTEAADDDFLPQFVIHSGRSKPNGDDMPQKQPFIQFAALDNAVNDCKYTLTELLYSAHYES